MLDPTRRDRIFPQRNKSIGGVRRSRIILAFLVSTKVLRVLDDFKDDLHSLASRNGESACCLFVTGAVLMYIVLECAVLMCIVLESAVLMCIVLESACFIVLRKRFIFSIFFYSVLVWKL